jgi:hypothetical protein
LYVSNVEHHDGKLRTAQHAQPDHHAFSPAEPASIARRQAGVRLRPSE